MTDRADEIAERLGETLCDCLYGEDGTPCTAVRSEGFTLAITRREAAPLIRAYGDERANAALEEVRRRAVVNEFDRNSCRLCHCEWDEWDEPTHDPDCALKEKP